MASSKDYLNYILDEISELSDITYRQMMGEYIIYYKGKIAAYVCDDRLLVKDVPSALKYLKTIVYEKPYEGAKNMLLVEDIDDREYLTGLFEAIYEELPAPKKRKERNR